MKNNIECYISLNNPVKPIDEETFLAIVRNFLKAQGLNDPYQKDFWLGMIKQKKEGELPDSFLNSNFAEIIVSKWPVWFKKMALFARLTPCEIDLNKLEAEGCSNGGTDASVRRLSGYDDPKDLAFLVELDRELISFSINLIHQLLNPLIAYMNNDGRGHLMRGYGNAITDLLRKADLEEAKTILSVFKNNLIGIVDSHSQYSYESKYYAFDSLMADPEIPNSHKELALQNLYLAIEKQTETDVRRQALYFYVQSLNEVWDKHLLIFSVEILNSQLEFLERNRTYLQECPFGSKKARVILELYEKKSSNETEEYMRKFITFLLKFDGFIISPRDISFWEGISETIRPKHVWERMGVSGENLPRKITDRIRTSIKKAKIAMDEEIERENKDNEWKIEQEKKKLRNQQNLEDLQRDSWLL